MSTTVQFTINYDRIQFGFKIFYDSFDIIDLFKKLIFLIHNKL